MKTRGMNRCPQRRRQLTIVLHKITRKDVNQRRYSIVCAGNQFDGHALGCAQRNVQRQTNTLNKGLNSMNLN